MPFYLRSGKKLSKKLTQISVHFREPMRCLFEGCAANVLTFQIQPDESVHLQINNKIPGFGIKLHQGDFEFGYKMAFKGEIPGAYERLLLDFLEGDQRLFIRSDEIEAAWKFVDSITENPAFSRLPLYEYKAGSNGTEEADGFIKKVVPVVKIEKATDAAALGRALVAGDLPVVEITFRTMAAEESIRILSREVPDLLVGAGTVLTVEQADAAIAAGARFIVAPGFNPKVVDHCISRGVPIAPGISSPPRSKWAWNEVSAS